MYRKHGVTGAVCVRSPEPALFRVRQRGDIDVKRPLDVNPHSIEIGFFPYGKRLMIPHRTWERGFKGSLRSGRARKTTPDSPARSEGML